MQLLPGQRRIFGSANEKLAENFLRRRGFRTLNRNYQCRSGEIDLIVGKANTVVFVEVRFRKNEAFGTAVESVNPAKQARIIRCARHFLMHNPGLATRELRFDIIGITHEDSQRGYRVEWLTNAFQPGG